LVSREDPRGIHTTDCCSAPTIIHEEGSDVTAERDGNSPSPSAHDLTPTT
jgi:hypothetical protein